MFLCKTKWIIVGDNFYQWRRYKFPARNSRTEKYHAAAHTTTACLVHKRNSVGQTRPRTRNKFAWSHRSSRNRSPSCAAMTCLRNWSQTNAHTWRRPRLSWSRCSRCQYWRDCLTSHSKSCCQFLLEQFSARCSTTCSCTLLSCMVFWSRWGFLQ